MTKIVFAPFGIVAGIIAGLVGKRAFAWLWSFVEEEQAPEPKHRDVPWGKLIAALALEGAVFRATRGIFDRGSRETFEWLTGRWPGKERPVRG